MQLSAIGKIAQTEWLKTFDLRPDMNLTMGEYIIMPNHFHAIIIIGENQYNTDGDGGGNENGDGGGDGHVETQCIASLPQTPPMPPPPANQFGPQRKNLASIIRGFKIGVTTCARKINPGFAWQSRYHEHIIRNNESFERICNYIISNPENWDTDRYKTD
ncbi:transposase [Draconibacterium sediminis]|uniref:transposase n=1 Tax=Draconibacterium sediminis TaxID=1544798 RepID=UPI0026EF4231|nr:transposase [Draconibacterium sediminis]